ISHLVMAPLEMRYFAVERTANDGADMLNHWLFRQSQLWHAVPPGRPAPKMDPTWPLYGNGEYLVKQFDNEVDARAALDVNYKTDATWRSMLRTDWASAGMRLGTNLWAVYRKTLDVDPAWLAGLRGADVYIGFSRFDSSIRQMTINGVPIMENNQPVNRDKLLGAIKPGANLLTVLCSAHNDGNGGFAADFCIRRIPGADGDRMDFSTGWDVYTSDVEHQTVNFPWSGTRMMARKTVVIPEKYKGGEVWIETTGVSNGPGGPPCFVAANGRWRYTANNYGAKYGFTQPFLINITSDIHFGEKNEIWLSGNNWHDGLRPTPGNYGAATLILIPPKPGAAK
ncbi:MAG TPA: hypothetical protein VGM23_04565, partial [Armatimonadota bacterium]